MKPAPTILRVRAQDMEGSSAGTKDMALSVLSAAGSLPREQMYCRAFVGETMVQTKATKSTTEPVWNEHFTVADVSAAHDSMDFHIVDKDLLTADDLVASFVLPRERMDLATSGVWLRAIDKHSKLAQRFATRATRKKGGAPSKADLAALEADARRAFLAADTDGDGTLDVGEMRTLAQSMGVHAGEELQTAIEQMDGDGDGEISVEEFVQWWCDTFQ